MTFHSFTLVYGGMLGSWRISSISDMALDARTAGVKSLDCSASMESLAALLMFLGVVLSSETIPRTVKACLMRSSYSSIFFFLTILPPHLPSDSLVI